MKLKIELEFDEEELCPGWMNIYNLELLLYSKAETRRDLLKINSCKEVKNRWDGLLT